MAQKTFLQLTQDAQRQCDDDSATAKLIIQSGINESYSEICGLRDWKQLENNTTISAISGTQEYTPVTSSASVPRIRRLESIKDETSSRYIDYIQREVFEKSYPYVAPTDTGTPSLWYISGYNSNSDIMIKLFKVPDCSRTYRAIFYEEPLELLNDSDVPRIPDQFHQGLTYLGLAKYFEYQKDSFATYYRQMHEAYKAKVLTIEYSPYDQMPSITPEIRSKAVIVGKIGRIWN
jgi:hypothetical protein